MIEVFADISCPFAYVQLHELPSRRTQLGKDVHVRTRAWPLELVNDVPTDPAKIADEVAALQAQVDSSLFAGFDAQRLRQQHCRRSIWQHWPIATVTRLANKSAVRCARRCSSTAVM